MCQTCSTQWFRHLHRLRVTASGQATVAHRVSGTQTFRTYKVLQVSGCSRRGAIGSWNPVNTCARHLSALMSSPALMLSLAVQPVQPGNARSTCSLAALLSLLSLQEDGDADRREVQIKLCQPDSACHCMQHRIRRDWWMNDSQLQKKFAGGAGSRSPQTAAKGHVRTVIRKDAPRSYKVCVAKRVTSKRVCAVHLASCVNVPRHVRFPVIFIVVGVVVESSRSEFGAVRSRQEVFEHQQNAAMPKCPSGSRGLLGENG